MVYKILDNYNKTQNPMQLLSTVEIHQINNQLKQLIAFQMVAKELKFDHRVVQVMLHLYHQQCQRHRHKFIYPLHRHQ